jgi:hypothetical protein
MIIRFLGLPLINKASRLCAIYSTHIVQRATTDQSEVRKLYYAVEFVPVVEASKFVTIEVESRSQVPACSTLYTMHYIDDLYHMHHYHNAATGDMVKSFVTTEK